jgi:autotransporter-associated beta strand protein
MVLGFGDVTYGGSGDVLNVQVSSPEAGSTFRQPGSSRSVASAGNAAISSRAHTTTSITNAGEVSGSIGIDISPSDTGDTTVTNFGAITGTGGTAVRFSAGNDLLDLVAGGDLIGNILGGGGIDTLRLSGAGADAFNVSQIGAGFEIIEKAGTSTWTLIGTTSFSGETRLLDGALALLNEGAVGTSLIRFTGGGQTLHLFAGATGADNVFNNTIADLGVGDGIDLRGLAFTANSAATLASNTLTVSNGTGNAVFLTLGNAAFTAFRVVSDGAGGTLVTGGPTNGDDNLTYDFTNDLIRALNGNDLIVAAAGNDAIFGDAGNDVLFGGAGNDRVFGGTGNDTLFGDDGVDSLFGDAGNDVLRGGGGNDVLRGGAGNDRILGDAGNDRILGDAGNDSLFGNAGNDIVTGGLGRDIMTGGAGADDFDFNSVAEIGRGGTRDVIRDFGHLVDDIDLRTIDANGSAAGHTFTFLAAKGAAFTGARGELRWFQQNNPGTASDRTIIEGDINGNGVADFQIQLAGLKALTAADVVL